MIRIVFMTSLAGFFSAAAVIYAAAQIRLLPARDIACTTNCPKRFRRSFSVGFAKRIAFEGQRGGAIETVEESLGKNEENSAWKNNNAGEERKKHYAGEKKKAQRVITIESDRLHAR